MILLLFLVGVTFAVLNRFWVVRNPSFKTHEEAELKVIENTKSEVVPGHFFPSMMTSKFVSASRVFQEAVNDIWQIGIVQKVDFYSNRIFGQIFNSSQSSLMTLKNFC